MPLPEDGAFAYVNDLELRLGRMLLQLLVLGLLLLLGIRKPVQMLLLLVLLLRGMPVIVLLQLFMEILILQLLFEMILFNSLWRCCYWE
jgi:hypothetical protein